MLSHRGNTSYIYIIVVIQPFCYEKNIVIWYVYTICIFWIPYGPNYIYWWTPRIIRLCWNFTFFVHIAKYLDFCVWGGVGRDQLLMYLIWFFSALYIFKFESNPLKNIVIWFINMSHTFKIPIKYDYFL